MRKLRSVGPSGMNYFQIASKIALKIREIDILHSRFSFCFLSAPKAFHFYVSKHSDLKLCGRSKAIRRC